MDIDQHAPASEQNEPIDNPEDDSNNKKRKRSPSPQPKADSQTPTKKAKKPKKPKKRKGGHDQAVNKAYERVQGKGAQPSVEFHQVKAEGLKIRDIQSVIMWVMGEIVNPSFVLTPNKSMINKTVILVMNSLQWDLYEAAVNNNILPNIASIFPAKKHVVKCRAPGSNNRMYDGVAALMRRPLSKHKASQLKKMAAISAAADQAGKGVGATLALLQSESPETGDNTTEADEGNGVDTSVANDHLSKHASDFLLSESDMLNNLYPLADTADGYVTMSADAPVGANRYDILGVDCEMCSTASGLELTRISLVDKDLNTVYDTFVKPERLIVDYHTRWSGITKETLENVTTTLSDVQTKLQEFIGPTTILVGHSLENDLHAMKVLHKRVADTAILYPHLQSEAHKNSLKFLALKFLREEVQSGSHDSIQDAVTALKLFLLKVKHGHEFGVGHHGDKEENILETLARTKFRRSALIDRPELCRAYSASKSDCFGVQSDAEALSQALKTCKSATHEVVFVHLHDLEHYNLHEESQWLFHSATDLLKHAEEPLVLTPKLTEVLQRMDKAVGDLFAVLPKNTMLVATGGHGNMARVKSFHDRKQQNYRDSTKPWTPEDEAGLEKTVDVSRHTVAFVAVKTE